MSNALRVLLACLGVSASCFAQTGKLGIFTTSGDVGAPAIKGSAEFSGGQYRITGSGANIWSKQDQFQYVWREMSGNFSVTARVQFLGKGADHRKAGIMVRQSLDTDSTDAAVMIHGNGMPGLQWRSKQGENTNTFDLPFDGPSTIQMKLVRTGVKIYMYMGKGDAEPKLIANTEVSFQNPVLVGLAVCAHQADASETVIFSDVSVEAQAATATTAQVPEWAQPGSATHTQVAPPADFHRPSRNFDSPIGIFEGQSDIGSAVVPGSASYDAASNEYTINSAGYNIWYSRDEFRYLWKKMSGDVSLAADVTFPDAQGYNDRKGVLVIRENLEDDSKEAVTGEHGTGMIHLAQRPEKGALMTDEQFRFGGGLAKVKAKRIGIEKRGDSIAIFISLEGEPMHQFGPPITLHFDKPFYVGIGFCSHLPDKSDTVVLSNVILENSAGKVR